MHPSQFEKVEITCPVCLNEEQGTIWQRINAQSDPDLKQRLLKKTLQVHPCSNCGHEVLISTDFVYVDPDKKLIIACQPSSGADRHNQSIPSWQQTASDNGWLARITINTNQLIEKIHVLDNGKDDRLIELVKLSLLRQPDQSIKPSRLYYYSTGDPQDSKLRFMAETKNGQWYHLDLDQEIYENTRNMVHQSKIRLTQPLIVDETYATSLLRSLAQQYDARESQP